MRHIKVSDGRPDGSPFGRFARGLEPDPWKAALKGRRFNKQPTAPSGVKGTIWVYGPKGWVLTR